MPKLILIGGNEFKTKDGIDEYMVTNFGSVIDLLPYAGEDAGVESTLLANERYNTLGVAIHPFGSRELSAPPGALAPITYIPGGNQDRLRDTLRETPLWQKLVGSFSQNEVGLAGSSAGAMVLCERMVSHESEHAAQAELTSGLGLIKGNVMMVPHWNKLPELYKTSLIDTNDRSLIIAVDENTALIWEYGEAQVIGLGKVVIYNELVRNEYKSGDNFKLELTFN